MSPRALQKKLLLLEAEVRRRQLAADWEATQAQLHAGLGQAKQFGAVAAAAALGWTAISLFRGKARPGEHRPAPPHGFVVRGLKLAVAMWPAWKAIRDRAAGNRR